MTRCASRRVRYLILNAFAITAGACAMPPVTYVRPAPIPKVTPLPVDVVLHLPPALRSGTLQGANKTGVITSYSIPSGELVAQVATDVARDAFRSVEIVEADSLVAEDRRRLRLVPAVRAFEPEEGPERWAWSRLTSRVSVRWRLLGPWGDAILDTSITGAAEGARGPAGGKKQTAGRTSRALQDLYQRSVTGLTESATLSNAVRTWLPLVTAAMEGDSSGVDSLLASGVPADAADASGRTALMGAAERGHVGVATLLIQRGADPERESRGGRTAAAVATGAAAAVIQGTVAERRRARLDSAWRAAETEGTEEAYVGFLQRHRESEHEEEGWLRVARMRETRTPGLARTIEQAIVSAPELSTPPLNLGMASNIIIQRDEFGMRAYARVPSSSAAVPVDGATFVIKQVRLGVNPQGIVAHCRTARFPVTTLSDPIGTTVLIVPREALPCQLELRGVLVTRVALTR
jgi:hypothetical protein